MVKLRDTYFFLLENPGYRRFELCSQPFGHRSASFSRETYQAARRFHFASWAHAYRDWLEIGRPMGLDFAPGRNTLLKLVLKVKDEPHLLPQWIDYHRGIVGLHNLVILDCGSTDPDHLAILDAYRDRILILDYPHYYDTIHDTELNAAFYGFLARNCRYVCVLDADEFLFGHAEGRIGREPLLDLLRRGAEGVYAGTWFPNLTVPEERDGRLDWSRPLRFDISPESLVAGTVAGKAVVRSDLSTRIRHVGHNLHVPEVVAAMRLGSFGRIGILHVSRLGPDIARARSLKHLRAKGAVPAALLTHEEVRAHLAARCAAGELSPVETHYAAPFLRPEEPAAETGATFETALIGGGASEPNTAFSDRIAGFDFRGFLA